MQLHQQQVLRDNAINDKVGTIQDEINVTLLLYCEDHSVLSPLVLSLWSRKLLILSGTLNTLDTAYRRASERFKVFLIHAPDLAKNPLGMQLVKVWLSERRPVFFFSSDLSKFPSIAPLESCFEFPLTDQDLNTLVLRGIGMKDMEEPVEAHSPFKVPPYRLGRKLGAGAFGTVFEAEMIETGALCAVKCIYLKEDEVDDPNNPQLREIAQEVEIMSSLSHPNIVRYMFCERDDKCISIFMELCSEPPLSAMVNKEKLLDPQVVKGILLDIVSAVTYLHKKRIVHRDLKPDNVLFRDGVAKVTDFGTAVHKRRSYDLNNFKGTLTYMAPEIVVAEPYGKACDVWSIGCIAAEVLCVRLPQKGLGLAELCDFYRSLSLTKPLDVDVNVPLVKNFLQCCLQRNPKERWTAAQLLEHDLLKRENNELHRWLEYVAEQRVNASSTIDDLNDTLISEEGTF
ncbi:protein kinase [Angomonas deanei]|uniref:Protein kinase domain/Protein tyrosine kinase/Kinase-like/Phosphotransferase enzyme family, putative n=1 Tax=Angomonas deanei TaxID=59799 RepID=A0A7G2BZC2_9TRYP|nr:protein kinase [Angomonas deanei]CAD2212790.1 Protein kinase domain/Protein tyrosine kinase/Kinase-like/Phosphotransferase enzyme family, putative [Angomonas deanei]|eukprot:EPY20641.1 protein kinase [Angomonas deanei]